MLISLKLTAPMPMKRENEDEGVTPAEECKPPELNCDDFDFCAGCKTPFKGAKIYVNGPVDGSAGMESADGESQLESQTQGTARRGQQPIISETVGEGRKIKEFYSFNLITGELLHVTALQALLSVFELRQTKSAPGLNLQDANEKLGFCQNCGTLFSQLYKLHQEVAGLVQNGSIVSKLLEYEDLLTDTQETDFANPKKRRKIARAVASASRHVNGVTENIGDMEHDGSTSWNGDADVGEQEDPSWSNDDYDMGNDEPYEPETEVNVKPRVNRKSGGIKITSVASKIVDDLSDSGDGSRRRRSATKNVDYRKVLAGPHIDGVDDEDDDEDWREEGRKSGGKTTARKKTGGQSASAPKKGRGRPTKGASQSSRAKVVVPPTNQKHRDSTFKSPADKSREGTCNICHKLFPANYLTEHMNVAHNAVSGQPCLICGKVFENSYKAIKHLLTHVPEKAFGCSRCHDTFKTAEERNQHTSSHLDSDKKLDCPKCPMNFTSLLLLNKHEAQKHRQTKSFLCSICAKLLTGKDEWIQHILSHGPFQCYYCKVFLRPGEYKRHVQTIHISRPKLAAAATGPIAEVTLD